MNAEISEHILTVALYGNANKEIRKHLHSSFESWQAAEVSYFEAKDWFAMADVYDAAQEFVKTNYSI